tara:strand:+ start:1912 stop:2676 length:765 start_codon:yes stop_codon:yes gene_type:complete
MTSPSILIVNDDSIFSEGIKALWEAMSEIGNTTVVAPKSDNSGAGHAITISKPLQFEKINLRCGLSGYAVDGTPADSVKFAMNIIMKKKPDILVSGINPGFNVGQSILYSGTVSAAREGSFRGVDSIAISLDSNGELDYSTSKTISKKIVQYVLKNRLPDGTFLNVNIPNLSEDRIKGFKITNQGSMYFSDSFDKINNSRDLKGFWLTAEHCDPNPSEISDSFVVKEGYVSITPLHSEQTNFKFIKELSSWSFN